MRSVKWLLGVALLAWALSGAWRRQAPAAESPAPPSAGSLRLPPLPPRPIVTVFRAGDSEDHGPGGMGLAFSYYRED